MTGTAGNDTFAATDSTFTLGDTIRGGTGVDKFSLSSTAAYTGFPTGAEVSGIENFIINGAAAITADIASNADMISLITATSGAHITTLTGSATQNLTASVSGATTTTSGITTTGGKDVLITYSSLLATAATGSVLAPSGAAGTVTVNATQTSAAVTNTNATTGGAINVTGGTSVNVTQNIAATAAAATTLVTGSAGVTHKGGKVTVTGSAVTKDVTVTQTATNAAVNSSTIGREGITAGAVDVLDANRSSTTAAGTIETVTLTNAGAAVVNSGALKTLNLVGTLDAVNAGTLGALASGANSTLALNLTGTSQAASTAVTIDDDIKTLNISGNTTASTLVSLVANGATTINVAGDAKVGFVGNTTGAVTAINVTNSKGAAFGTAIGTGVTFTGGAGDDGVTLSNAFTKAINMGAGNDIVTIGGTTIGTGGSVAGGDGIDTLVMTTAFALSLDDNNIFNSKFSSFEALELSSANIDNDILDLDGINGVSSVILNAEVTTDFTLNNLASGGTVTLTKDGLTTPALVVGVKSAILGSADVLNLKLSTSGASLAAGSVTAANVETINISAFDANDKGSAAHINTLTLAATSATTVTVAGNNGLTLTNTNNTKIVNFDASGIVANNTAASTYVAATTDSAANLAVTFASANTTASANVTIKGGSGNDTLTGTIAKDNISGGAGNDTIYADNAGNKAITATANVTVTAAGTGVVTAKVGFAGIETAALTVVKLDTVNTTAEEIAIGISAAIAADPVMSQLIKATVVGVGVVLTSLVDGVLAAPTVTLTKTGTIAPAYIVGTLTAGTAGTVAVDTIDGGAGADLIVGGGGADILTGGAGVDTFFFLKGHSNQAALATITDYTYAVGGSSNDKIILGDVVTAAGTITKVQDLSSSATLGAAFNAAALSNTQDLGLVAFIFGGNTYMMVETTGATSDYVSSDFAVKLTGTPIAAGTALAGLGFDAI